MRFISSDTRQADALGIAKPLVSLPGRTMNFTTRPRTSCNRRWTKTPRTAPVSATELWPLRMVS
jgi:hypothetical protein